MSVNPFYDRHGATVYVGHTLNLLSELPAGSVHCVVTSPPYWGLRNYGTEGQVWGGNPECCHTWDEVWTPNNNCGGGITFKQSTNAGSYCSEERDDGGPLPRKTDGPRGHTSGMCTCGAWRGEYGSEPLHDCMAWAKGETPCAVCFVCHTRTIFGAVWRVLRDDGSCWVNLGDSYNGSGGAGGDYSEDGLKSGQPKYSGRNVPSLKRKDLTGIPWRVALALQADGWYLRNDVIWHKTNPMPSSVRDRLTSSHEHIFLLAKSERYFFDADAIRETATTIRPVSELQQLRPDRGYPGSVADRKRERRTNKQAETAAHASEASSRMMAGFNDRWDASEANGTAPQGRNKRDVWSLSSHAYKGAHFATYPPALVEPCILAGTSAKGCCASCGAPWVRVVEKGEPLSEWQQQCGANGDGEYHGTGQKDYEANGVQNASAVKARILTGMCERKTLRWEPSCGCEAGDPVPCTVLDPFSGSGTTGAVALKRHRKYIGLELNPEYAALSAERLEGSAPLQLMLALDEVA